MRLSSALGTLLLGVTFWHIATATATDSPTVLITGASRGIGLEFTRQYADRGWNIIATARTPQDDELLQALAAQYDNVSIEQLDVTDHAEIDAVAKKLADQPIDILLNNAGISGEMENQIFGKINYDVFDDVMMINVVGPLKMSEAFIDHVAASDMKKIINVTSGEGSIGRVQFPALYFYRSSKSALNMVMVNLARTVKDRGVTVGIIGPGLVRTDFTSYLQKLNMNLPFQTPEESVNKYIAVIDDYGLEDSGSYLRNTGDTYPW